MTNPEIRGSWTFTEALVAAWETSGAEAWLKARGEWASISESRRAELPAFGDEDLPAKTPMPYVRFEQGDPVKVSSDSGLGTNRHCNTWRIPVVFTAFARTKEIARDAIRTVKNVYEDKPLDVSPDRFVLMDSGPDRPEKLGDTEWSWAWRAEWVIDSEHATNR